RMKPRWKRRHPLRRVGTAHRTAAMVGNAHPTGDLNMADSLPQIHMPDVPVHPVLAGQKALVTGANSGIGKAVAIALGQAGADVVVNYVRGDEQAAEVCREASRFGSKAYAHQADVSNEEQVHGMFEKMISTLGTIDILVNNAGLQQDSPIEKMSLQQWNT